MVSPAGPQGQQYFLTLVDKHTGYTAVSILQSKNQTEHELPVMIAQLERQSGHKLGTLRTDNGGEYMGASLQEYIRKQGIRHELTVPYSPQQNGAAERMNDTILTRVRCILHDTQAPKTLWPELVQTVTHIHNLLPTRKNDITPTEAFTGIKPSAAHLRIIGSKAYAAVLPAHRNSKLTERAQMGRLVGYSQTRKAYRILVEGAGNIVESRDVIFNEADTVFTQQPAEEDDWCPLNMLPTPANVPTDYLNLPEQTQTDQMQPQTEQPTVSQPVTHQHDTRFQANRKAAAERVLLPPLRQKSQRTEQPQQQQQHQYNTRQSAAQQAAAAQPTAHSIHVTPDTYKQAMESTEKNFWYQAMNDEWQSMQQNGVLELTDLKDIPKGQKVIPGRWVFTKKFTAEGELDKHKARYVAQGFRQVQGVDYKETYAPTSHRTTLRAFLAEVANGNMELRQLDVKTAFLQSELAEEVYVQPPPGFEVPGSAYRIRKALYGLKQAPRAWHAKLKQVLESLGFAASRADQGLYILDGAEGKILLLTYVDDLLIAAKESAYLEQLIAKLMGSLDIRDLGDANLFLNMHITRDRQAGTLKLSQRKQIEELLEEYNMAQCTVAKTPLTAGVNLTKLPGDPDRLTGSRLTKYQALLGSINYIAGNTRPDIAFAAGALSRALRAPTEGHWTAALHVLRYLRGTTDLGIVYGGHTGTTEQLTCYHDADFAADTYQRKSLSAFVWQYNGGAISWKSTMQKLTAGSTTEAEYIAAGTALREGLWLQKLMLEITGAWLPLTQYCDNKSAVDVIHKGICENDTKHISLRYHFMHQHVALQALQLIWISTHEMVADCLTKQLGRDQANLLHQRMGMA
jgi:hypothetical protein